MNMKLASGKIEKRHGPLMKVKEAEGRCGPSLMKAGDEIRTHDLLLGKETFYH